MHDTKLIPSRHAKTIKTALGEMTLKRAYYDCKTCQTGFFLRAGELEVVLAGDQKPETKVDHALAALG